MMPGYDEKHAYNVFNIPLELCLKFVSVVFKNAQIASVHAGELM